MAALAVALAAPLLSAGILAPAPAAQGGALAALADQRPNVLVVNMDDMRADELAYVPTVRRLLVAEGITFRNSFAPNPLCCPSRTSFLLGQYSHNHRVLSHEKPYGFAAIDDSSTIAGRLRRAGYRTGFVGKYLNGYGQMRSKVTGGSSLRYVPAGWEDWRAGVQSSLPGGTYSYFSFTRNVDGTIVRRPGVYSSQVIADDARALVGKYHRGTKPWFLWVNPVAPHHGMPVESDDPATITLPSGRRIRFVTPARPDWVKGHFDRAIRHAPGVRASGGPSEADVTDKPGAVRSWPEANRRVRAALLEVERQRAESLLAWDRQFARIVATLKTTGEWRDTVVVFTSDNGYMVGEHRVPLAKIFSYEDSLRVPLVVSGPGVLHGVRRAPAMTIDLTATVLDLADARMPGQDGQSLVPLLTGPDRPWTRAVVTEGYLPGSSTSLRLPAGLSISGLRTGRWKAVRWSTGFVELYDLRADPLELTNLARDPAYRTVRSELMDLARSYADCAAAACRAPLPEQWQVSRTELAETDRNAVRARLDYYGAPSDTAARSTRP